MGVHCTSQTHQKRASDLITDGCEPPCGCWDLSSGPLEERWVLLTAEPCVQAGDFGLNVSELWDGQQYGRKPHALKVT